MRTPVCELLGIEQPIVQAPMSAVPQLAAAVSDAGALGMLAFMWSTPAGDPVRETAALTDRPFGGNLILNSDQHRRLDEALEAGLRIVSLMWGDPARYVEQVHDANGLVLHTVGSAEQARRAAASGVDVVVAQGWEAGGHVWSQVATLPLVPAVVDAVAPVPVIAAGGIGDARGVAAVLALGAEAAWLGALRGPDGHNQPQKSWPSSSPACKRRGGQLTGPSIRGKLCRTTASNVIALPAAGIRLGGQSG
jgi:nitronate monooxygenase